MNHAPSIRFAAIAVFFLAAGCSQEPKQPSELEQQVQAIINETFAGNTENWFAVDSSWGKTRLVELHGPAMSWREENVSETERMNGVELKAVVWVNCRQFRSFDGKWSEWQQGAGATQGMGAVLLEAMGPLTAHWSAHLQKKNGQWTVNSGGAGGQFRRDRGLLRQLMQQASA